MVLTGELLLQARDSIQDALSPRQPPTVRHTWQWLTAMTIGPALRAPKCFHDHAPPTAGALWVVPSHCPSDGRGEGITSAA